MMRRFMFALVLVLVAAICVVAQPVSVDAAAGVCEDLPGASLAGGQLAGSTPVVLVHGFTGSNVSWFAPIDQAIDDDVEVHNRSLVEQLLRIDGVSVWLFEYHDTSARWVTDPRIGPALADLLECLADNGGQPAVLTVHSMGGLAARHALSLVDDPGVVSGLVTFGTPHLGSDLAAFIRDVAQDNSTSGGFLGPIKAAVRYSLQLCGQTKTVNADYDCGWLDGVPPIDSEAGQALITGSKQLKALPPVPGHVQTVGLAGEIEIVVQDSKWGFFYESHEPWPIGDTVVSVDSATAMSDESRSWTCQLNFKKGYAISDDARQLFGLNYDDGKERGISEIISNPCYHSNLMHTVEITNEAIYHINSIVETQKPLTPEAIADLIDCTGDCQVTGTILFNHPTWGRVVLATYVPVGSSLGASGMVVIDSSRNIVWDWATDDGHYYTFELAGQQGPLYLGAGFLWSEDVVSTSVDALGHIFIDYDPGRYNGVIVLKPTADGFEDFGTLGARDDYLKRFYFAETVDTDGDGQFEILQYGNDCDPSCAGGEITSVVWRWDGNDYVQASAASSVPGEPVDGSTVVEADGMGAIRVGMTLREVARATGQSIQTNFYDWLDLSEGRCFFAWITDLDGQHLIVRGNGPSSRPSEGTVGAIFVREPVFAADVGIRVGDSEASLLERLGERLVASRHEYFENGAYYDLAAGGDSTEPLVTRFTVEEGTVVEISAGYAGWATLVEGCL